jgi:hypothetical protein
MRSLKIVAVFVGVLAVCSAGIGLFFRLHKPFPSLAAGLPHIAVDAEREFDRRLKESFPIGSSGAALRAALKEDGWGEPITFRDMQYVSFTKAPTLIVKQKATIVWRLDDEARLTEISGRYGLIGP